MTNLLKDKLIDNLMKLLFTHHAKMRLKKRRIFADEVISTIRYPDSTNKRHDKYYFQKDVGRGKIEVCCEKTERIIKVITVYWM